jgi:hypothetical protein
LKGILSEFESSPGITADDQFVKERSQILSDIELDLEKRRNKEAHSGEAIKSLSDNRILLERIEKDYATATKEIEGRKHTEIKRLSGSVEGVKQELDRIVRMKTGIFRAISKNAKVQKETEAKLRLNTAQDELALAVQHFTAEQEKLRDGYERRRQAVLERIQDNEREVESQEVDGSSEARRAACEALISTVNSFLERKGLLHH